MRMPRLKLKLRPPLPLEPRLPLGLGNGEKGKRIGTTTRPVNASVIPVIGNGLRNTGTATATSYLVDLDLDLVWHLRRGPVQSVCASTAPILENPENGTRAIETRGIFGSGTTVIRLSSIASSENGNARGRGRRIAIDGLGTVGTARMRILLSNNCNCNSASENENESAIGIGVKDQSRVHSQGLIRVVR